LTRLEGGLPDGASASGASSSDAALSSVAHQLPKATDPDLARMVEAWPDLPQHIRAAILALAQTATPHQP
jgi:hypothetical protein